MKCRLQPNEQRRQLITLFVEEEPWRDLHTSIYGRTPQIPKCDSLESFQEKFKQFEYQKVKAYIFKRLSERSMHSIELQKTLAERAVPKELITQMIAECERLGFIQDQERVDALVRTEVNRKKGPNAIRQKLRAKGLSSEEIGEAIEELVSEEAQKEQVKQLLETKYRKRDLNDYKERQKVIAALIRRGYSFGLIQSFFSDI